MTSEQKAGAQLKLSEGEQRAILADPNALLCLMNYHDAQQIQADSMFDAEDRPHGNEIRRQELYEHGRSIMAQDLDIWPDDLRKEFGFPAYQVPA